MSPVAESVKTNIPCSSGAGVVGSIPANFDAQNVRSFRRCRFEMKLSVFLLLLSGVSNVYINKID
jgi:hypothetical protein